MSSTFLMGYFGRVLGQLIAAHFGGRRKNFADAIGVSPGSITAWLNSPEELPNEENVRRIFAAAKQTGNTPLLEELWRAYQLDQRSAMGLDEYLVHESEPITVNEATESQVETDEILARLRARAIHDADFRGILAGLANWTR